MPDDKIAQHARDLTNKAELGQTGGLQEIHNQLQKDMRSMTAMDYGKLLSTMKSQNADDVNKNFHLPLIELYDSSGDKQGQNDAVRDRYSNGDVVEMTSDAHVTSDAHGTSGAHGAALSHAGAQQGSMDYNGMNELNQLNQYPNSVGP